MDVVGLVVALLALMLMALRGVNIIIAALTSTLIVLLSNQIDIATGLNELFVSGRLGAFTFMGNFFLLFVAGSVFGALMGHSGAADSIAHALAEKLGTDKALWIITLACALLTYGGVSVFVVLFSVKSLGLKLIEKANIPLKLMIGAVALGIGTFTLTALPGTPSLNNIMAAKALGTDPYAAPWLGLLGAALMFGFGMFYLERRRKALVTDTSVVETAIEHDESLPHWIPALAPILVVLLGIAFPATLSGSTLAQEDAVLGPAVAYAQSQPIFWPVISLFAGSIAVFLLLPRARVAAVQTVGDGAAAAVMPLLSTSMVIGFGSVVSQTPAFQTFVTMMTSLDASPYIALLASVNVISGITGSSAGGLQIFLATMGSSFVDMGIPPEVLHRLAAMASGGLDSLPHNGGVIAILMILGTTHRVAYRDIAVVTVAIPLLVTLVCTAVAAFVY